MGDVESEIMRIGTEKTKKIVIVIAIITFCGFFLRALSCFWGYPLTLHPDERTIVNNAMDMLGRRSWIAYVYNRPDQFEIKCNAVIFELASRILFKAPAVEAFEYHYAAFYVFARAYTTVFGTAMIPLASVIAGRMIPGTHKNRAPTEIITAIVFAFSPILIEHSAYATPDVVLAFFVLLFACLAQNYLESGKNRYFLLCALSTAIGITIKYPAAILGIPLAMMVIYRRIKGKNYIGILRDGVMGVVLVVVVVFLIAPNLFTDYKDTYATIVQEARPHHLGADGLGWVGNMKYYFLTVMQNCGYISFVLFAAGIFFAIQSKDKKTWILVIGFIYWFCISFVSLHWIQWGIPFYVFYYLLVSLGMGAILRMTNLQPSQAAISKGVFACIAGLVLMNSVVSGIGKTKERLIRDTCNLSLDYCIENGILRGNSLYEGYTPLCPNDSAGARWQCFSVTDDGVQIKEQYAANRYFVLSGSYRNRYFAEPTRYPDQVTAYHAVEDHYRLIYSLESNGGYKQKPLEVINIPYSAAYLLKKNLCSGNTILIYDLDPHFVEIKSSHGLYLKNWEEGNDKVALSSDRSKWLIYQREDGKVSLLTEAGMSIGCDAETGELCLVAAGEGIGFERLSADKETVFKTDETALTAVEGKICLTPYAEKNTTQMWSVAATD